MIRLAEQTDTPIMSTSSLRYTKGVADLVAEEEEIVFCEAFGPAPLLEDYPGLFWYGIHGAEILFSYMGPGCTAVQCAPREEMDVVIGEWEDGRIGLLRGTRFPGGVFGCMIHTGSGLTTGQAKPGAAGYAAMLQEVVHFFESRVSPIETQVTLGIVSFLEAAERSRSQSGAIVRTDSL